MPQRRKRETGSASPDNYRTEKKQADCNLRHIFFCWFFILSRRVIVKLLFNSENRKRKALTVPHAFSIAHPPLFTDNEKPLPMEGFFAFIPVHAQIYFQFCTIL